MSGLYAPIDAYCERLSPEFWAEPFNAFTNIFIFLAGVAGFYLSAQLLKRDSPSSLGQEPFSIKWLYALSFAACLTGVGSFLFHTFANFLTLWGDIMPIMIFMEIFLAFTLREIFKWKWLSTVTAMVLFFAVGIALQLLLPKGLLNGSVTYIHGVAVLVGILHALNHRFRLNPEDKNTLELMKKFASALIIFLISLSFRTFDHAICEDFSLGTHFVWHTLNGLLLFQLIRVAVYYYKTKTV